MQCKYIQFNVLKVLAQEQSVEDFPPPPHIEFWGLVDSEE